MSALLAEDHPINQKVVEPLLCAFNVELTIASNGREAVERYRRGRSI